jgi:hypothetical protein
MGYGLGLFVGKYNKNIDKNECKELLLSDSLFVVDVQDCFYNIFLKSLNTKETILYGYGDKLYKIRRLK